MIGRLWAAATPNLQEILRLDIEMRAFLLYWKTEIDTEKMRTLGSMLGTAFSISEITAWTQQPGPREYAGDERVNLPLSILLKPELREGLIKTFITDTELPKDYVKGNHEKVIDMGKWSSEEFKAFFEKRKVPDRYAERQKPKASSWENSQS